MLDLILPHQPRRSPAILCLGAHADDIEVGAGGTIFSLLGEYPRAHVHWVVLSAAGEREREARASANGFLAAAGSSEVAIHAVRDGFFPAEYGRLKGLFEKLKRIVDPDIILTHRHNDAHQDHRTVAELSSTTFRNHLMLEYEIPKYDPDLGNPNLLVPLSRKCADAKVKALMRHFASQRDRHWFTPDTFYGVMRLRGVQCAAASGFAEGFHVAKFCLKVGTEQWNGESDFSERRSVAERAPAAEAAARLQVPPAPERHRPPAGRVRAVQAKGDHLEIPRRPTYASATALRDSPATRSPARPRRRRHDV